MSNLPRSALLRPAQTPEDCRHSRAAFHALFLPIARRTDLSDAAKLLHEAVVSMVRQGLSWTQDELAAQIGWRKRQTVWRAARELVAAGLLRVKRIGLGRPNEYHLVETPEVTQEDIKAKAPRTPGHRSGHQEGRIGNAHARAVLLSQERRQETGYIRPGQHAGYGRVARSSSELMMSRAGPIPRR